MIPKNIERNHIEEAIELITKNEIPEHRKEVHYALFKDIQPLPPKYIISIANKIVNGYELDSNEFNAIEAKNYLENKGFNIIDKRKIMQPQNQNFWIEKTLVNGRQDRISGDRAMGKALWSPRKDKRGADIYKNMRKVKKGDVVIHLVDNTDFIGASIVQENAIEASGLPETEWSGPAYLIRLRDYVDFDSKINKKEILNESYSEKLIHIKSKSEVFFTNRLTLRQGAYLTPCPIELVELINDVYKTKTGSNFPHLGNMFNLLSTDKRSNSHLLIDAFLERASTSNLKFLKTLIVRFVASIITKPFAILTGLSGSGKTKLAQAFVQWISASKDQYRIVPVGADWTNREPLLGYPNGLEDGKYVMPDSQVLNLLIDATKKENENIPFFLVLDEMNLSHVERYFADFLSVMESKDTIKLYTGKERKDNSEQPIPQKIAWPKNFFIIGTVNIDETTYMFSPKVLDRANVIEFRISPGEMEEFLKDGDEVKMKKLFIDENDENGGAGQKMGEDFLKLAKDKNANEKIEASQLNTFFIELQKVGAEFGYRSAYEIKLLLSKLSLEVLKIDGVDTLSDNDKIDIAIMQKLLPKLHGSRKKLVGPLEILAGFCLKAKNDTNKLTGREIYDDYQKKNENWEVIYPLSFEKIERMRTNAIENGFTSYAEA